MASSSMPYFRPTSFSLINRLGHWAVELLVATIALAVLLRLRPISPDNPMALIAPVALIALVIGSWLLMRRHDRRLCEPCMRSMPLDASRSAVRFRRRLAVAHLGSNKTLVIAYLAFLLGSAFLPGTVGMVIWIAAQSSMIYLLVSSKTHRRLQPWCPACRGRGGDDDTVDAPDPAPRGYQHA